jgi:hypothetical protein
MNFTLEEVAKLEDASRRQECASELPIEEIEMCQTCEGSGTIWITCSLCHGSGWVDGIPGGEICCGGDDTIDCPDCNGWH